MKIYVIHVSDAYERENHMHKQLKDKNNDVQFILEGDKKDLSQAVLDEYFVGDMKKVCNTTSCTYKHILAYKKVSEGPDDFVMILEDDIRFYSNYYDINSIIDEVKIKNLKNCIISLEDSNLKYVAKSDRIKGVKIYSKKKGRLAGAYLIDKAGATSILNCIRNEKIGLPIDWFHNLCVERGEINLFWSHPAIAVQGSLDGSIKSLLDSKKYGLLRVISFNAQRFYKKLLYQMR